MDLYEIKNLLCQGKNIYDLPLRVTFYARVSTDREEQLNSLENQVMYFNNLIKKQDNWTFVQGYVDEGLSGKSVKKRVQFLEMIEDAREKKFDLILTKEISRFSRNTLDSIQYTQELLSYGIGVHFLSDNINTFQADSELRLTIMASIAQEEVRKLSERVKFGYKRSVERGIVSGSNNIYGYCKNNGKLLIVEEEADIIKKIFDIYVNKNMGTTKIGIYLYEQFGIKNANGKPIHGTTIRGIIKNPKYKGYYCANKTATLDYRTAKRKKFGKDDWVTYKSTDEIVPAIVDEDLWIKANEMLTLRGKKHCNNDKNVYFTKYPLSGKILCFHDGATFVRGNYKLKNCKRIYWACSNYRYTGKKKSESCNTPLIYEDELTEIMRKMVRMIKNNRKDILSEIKDLINESSSQKDYKKDLIKMSEILEKAKSEKDELIKMRMRHEIDTSEYQEYKNKIDVEINKYEIELEKLKRNELLEKTDKMSLEQFEKRVDEIVISDDQSVMSVAETLFEKIYVETNTIDKTHKRTNLHIKLKVSDTNETDLSLSQLALVFRSDEGFCRTIR